MGDTNLEFADDNERRIYEEAIAFARANKKARCAQLTDPAVYPPEDHPVSVFMAGSPGAGKTEAARELIVQFERLPNAPKVLRIDPDDLRAEFDGYTGTNSWLFQGAASIWVDRMVDLVLAQGQSFILDGTLSDYGRAKLNIERSLKRRRAVAILYVYQSPLLAWEFVQAREAREGRRVHPKQFVDQYLGARDVVNRLKQELGAKITVDLLLKPNDQAHKLVRLG
ncbi:MAG: zeta toxin family protein, partial [Steroidobacteraceae bacterium]